ncbi:hypothetical protein IEE92_09440 [Kocuria sp. cx-116]|uniref:hypothetical protein n=1 Tax=Kocuria sp. cx-116 TaxID=2771378 RepID=UPI001689806C|nr:hypothetical protein [Kocuria sp. cx-116]MBD2762771.1 hypothetical protein [Kocuria sp. cx-116]
MNMLTTALLQAATDNPAGDLKPGLEPSQVSPGLAGFLATFFLVVVVILLILDFNRRNRRLRYRAQYAEQRAAEDGLGGYAHTSDTASRVTTDADDAARPPKPRTAPSADRDETGGSSAHRD